VHGRFPAAVHDNVLLIATLPLLAYVWLDWVARARAGRPARRPSAGALIAIVTALVVFTVVRNIPWAAALRPG
jgi:glucose uptake protein GlcU